MKNLLASWKTTLAGVLVMVCTGGAYLEALPEKYGSLIKLACGVAIAFGLIAAKDGDKSNAPNAEDRPHTVKS